LPDPDVARLIDLRDAGRDAARRLGSGLRLDEVTRARLQKAERAGTLALNQLVEANLGLVRKEARAYAWKAREASVGDSGFYDDLFQEGCIGLMLAAEKFDPLLGNRFATMACPWIRHYVARCVMDQARTIRVPAYIFERASRVAAARRTEDDEEAVAIASGIAPDQMVLITRALQQPTSLDTLVGEHKDKTLGELQPDLSGNFPDPLEATVQSEQHRALIALIRGALDDRKARILILRYGLDGGGARSLDAVGAIFGVTRERIRQLECKALKQIRYAAASEGMF